MTSPEQESPTRRNALIYGLAAALVIAVGVILGLVFFGGESETPVDSSTTSSSTLAADTTTTGGSAPSTTFAPTTTSTVPTPEPTQPPNIDADLLVAATEDATIELDSPDSLGGASDELAAEVAAEDEITRSLMRFEVTGIPEDANVFRATLRMFVIDEGGDPALHEVDGPWTESTVTWNNAPEVGAAVTSIPEVPDDSYVRVDVTSHVQENGTVEFYLVNESDNDYAVVSREGGDAPTLELLFGGDPSVMVGAGDIASCDSEGDEATAQLIGQVLGEAGESVVFTLGDNAYESGTAAQFADCYNPSWGQFKDLTRPAAGTRDYDTAGAAGYFEYFGAAAGNASEGYYSYDHAGWHIVVLNSNCAEVGGCDLGSPQATWLEQDLAGSDAACTVAYWHHPVFGSVGGGNNTDAMPFWEILDDAGADVILNGDHHFYERFAPQDPTGAPTDDGIVQFTVGTGGRSLAGVGAAAANSVVRFDRAFGVLVLTLNPGAYDWQFVSAGGDGFTDVGSATCR